MQDQKASAAWRSDVSHVLAEVAARGEVSAAARRALFAVLNMRRRLDAPADELAVLLRTAAAVQRLEFAIAHSAPVDLLRARHELAAAIAGWRKFLMRLDSQAPERRPSRGTTLPLAA